MKNIIYFTLLIFIISCAENRKKPTESSWSGKMQKTAKSFQALLPYIYNFDRFDDKKNKKKIHKKIVKFEKNIHKIEDSKAKLIMGDDPHALQGLRNLKELTSRAGESFIRGDNRTAQILLKSTSNTCFKCHTRQNLGPESVKWKNFDVNSIPTNPIERAHLLVSMRQYEEAKKQLKSFLFNRETDNKFDLKYERALHYYLMISLRAQKQWTETLSFLNSKSLVDNIPTRLHFTIAHWNRDLNSWLKNKDTITSSYNAAKNIVQKNRRFDTDRNLVNNLIASQLLHEGLASSKTNLDKAKAYLLLGSIYDDLIGDGYWDLPESYYETCIRYVPKTKTAQKCFENFKTNITLGYSGSRGTFIPIEEYERIEELRKISGLK